jgi:hypothetical protein
MKSMDFGRKMVDFDIKWQKNRRKMGVGWVIDVKVSIEMCSKCELRVKSVFYTLFCFFFDCHPATATATATSSN